MADTPSDDTPSSAPPPRRRTRGGKAAGKSTGGRAKAAAKPAPRRANAAVAAKATAPKKPAAPAKPTAPRAPRKPRAAARPAVKAAQKRGFGRILAITAATVLSVAAGAAAIFGRRKIAKVGTDAVDSVMGKSEPTPPTPSAD